MSLLFHSLHASSFCYSSLVACLLHRAHVKCHDKTLGPKSKDSSRSHLDLPSSLTVHVSARVSHRFTFVLIHLLSRLCSESRLALLSVTAVSFSNFFSSLTVLSFLSCSSLLQFFSIVRAYLKTSPTVCQAMSLGRAAQCLFNTSAILRCSCSL